MTTTTKEIISISEFNLGELFDPSKPELSEAMLAKIEKEALAEVCDCSTEEGRKREYTLARQISSIKTLVDDHGKGIVADAKAKIREVDSRRKFIRDKCDELRDKRLEGRKKWEAAEAERQQRHMEAVQFIQDMRDPQPLGDKKLNLKALETNLSRLIEIKVDESFEEFKDKAEAEYDKSFEYLNEAIHGLKQDIERDEKLARLEAEEAERKAKEREEQLRKEGEERAKRQLEEEQRKREAEANAKPEQEQVHPANPQPQPEQPAQTDLNREHRKRINIEIRDSLAKEIQIAPELAQEIVTAIYYGKINHLEIKY